MTDKEIQLLKARIDKAIKPYAEVFAERIVEEIQKATPSTAGTFFMQDLLLPLAVKRALDHVDFLTVLKVAQIRAKELHNV